MRAQDLVIVNTVSGPEIAVVNEVLPDYMIVSSDRVSKTLRPGNLVQVTLMMEKELYDQVLNRGNPDQLELDLNIA